MHKVAQCTAPRSYANASRRGGGDQQEMDDLETEDLHTIVSDIGKGTVGESAGEAATSSEVATANSEVTATTNLNEVVPTGAPVYADTNAPAVSVYDSSDEDGGGEQGDIEGNTTDPQVGADGFRRPTDRPYASPTESKETSCKEEPDKLGSRAAKDVSYGVGGDRCPS